jgi:hypothetical protein
MTRPGAQRREKVFFGAGIEVRGRFVCQYQGRVGEQYARETQPLPFAG